MKVSVVIFNSTFRKTFLMEQLSSLILALNAPTITDIHHIMLTSSELHYFLVKIVLAYLILLLL